MDTVFTIIQVLLALFLAFAGLSKLLIPLPKIAAKAGWVNDFKPEVVRWISIVEVCAAVAIILPLFIPSLTLLAPLAAVGTALIMAGAMATHLRRGEYLNMVGNFVWLGLALGFAYVGLVGFAA